MKIFVTGGTGFIGSYVLRSLAEEGHELVASKRPSSRMDLVKDIVGIEWVECDLFNITEVDDIIKECDAVVHIAGSVSFSPWKRDTIFKTNIELTANLINISLDNDIKRFIHFSSVAALGLSSKPIDEAQVWTENKSKNYYSLSKYLGEKEAWRGFAEGLNVSIINPSFTIGGAYWNYGPMSMVARIDNGLKYYPAGRNGCVDVRDISEMCAKLLRREDMSGRRFICSGHNISHFDLMKMMCDELNSPYPTTPINGLFGTLAWRGASFMARMRGKETLLSRESYTISSADLSYDNSQSQELLNMEYTSLKKTISDTIECYKKSKSEGRKYGVLR